LEKSKAGGCHFIPAPQPLDLIWKNLSMTDSARSSSKFFGALILIFAAALYTIPLLGVAALANIAAL
jgi:hypothetical protein